MADIIDEIFGTLRGGFLEPLAGNLSDVVGPVWALAMGLAVLSLIFGFFGKDKGPKLAVIALLAVFAIVWFGYKDDVFARLTSGEVAAPQPAAQGGQEGSAADEALDAVASAQRD